MLEGCVNLDRLRLKCRPTRVVIKVKLRLESRPVPQGQIDVYFLCNLLKGKQQLVLYGSVAPIIGRYYFNQLTTNQ